MAHRHQKNRQITFLKFFHVGVLGPTGWVRIFDVNFSKKLKIVNVWKVFRG